MGYFYFAVSCGQTVPLPYLEGQTINITDPRNCQNFYRCSGLSCWQCPCDLGETFNPVTLHCEATASACVCPQESTTTVSTTTPTPTTTTSRSTTATTTTRPFIVQDAGMGTLNSGHNSKTNEPVSSDVIIIAGIVSATVIVIVVIVMGVFCWQRRHSTQHA